MLKKGLKKIVKDRSPIGNNKKEFSFFKDELGKKVTKEFSGTRDLRLNTLQIPCLAIKSH